MEKRVIRLEKLFSNPARNFFILALAFLFSVFAAILLLLGCASVPSSKVKLHVKESAIVLAQEGDYPALSDRSDASVLDNFTDATMLMECMSTSILNPETILTNPKFKYADTLVDSLLQYSENPDEAPTSFYARYWMGFRVLLRPALSFLTYQEIKLYNSILLFALFSAVIVSISRCVGGQAAFSFALSFILVRPQIICNSLQFSNCFLIAFVFMLSVPLISEHPRLYYLFFMEAGIVTMFFDFYTTPLITFALPAMYLWLIQKNTRPGFAAKKVVSAFLIWLVGYVMMWIMKLVLTDLLTSVDGLKAGFSAMGNWTIHSVAGQGEKITPLVTVYRIISAIVADSEGVSIWGIALLLLCVFLFSTQNNRRKYSKNLRDNTGLTVFIVLVVLWFLITFKPTGVHYFFQYRTVMAAFWAFLLMIFLPSKDKASIATQP